MEFSDKSRPSAKEGKDCSLRRSELTVNAFKSGILPIKATQCEGIKILAPKPML